MHSALLIDELLRQIFLFIEDDRKSLLASARSCKAWKDPALDYIWEHLTSFGPLLLLLPGVSSRNGEYVGSCLLFSESRSRLTSQLGLRKSPAQ